LEAPRKLYFQFGQPLVGRIRTIMLRRQDAGTAPHPTIQLSYQQTLKVGNQSFST